MVLAEGVAVDWVGVSSEVSAFIATHRIARLATADQTGAPHIVPVCYTYKDGRLYSAIDLKPKHVEVRRLKRVRNISVNPKVALIVDDYSEDWSKLAYVIVQGSAKLLDGSEERRSAEAMLRDKYPQYDELLERGCDVLKIMPEKVMTWGLLRDAAR